MQNIGPREPHETQPSMRTRGLQRELKVKLVASGAKQAHGPLDEKQATPSDVQQRVNVEDPQGSRSTCKHFVTCVSPILAERILSWFL